MHITINGKQREFADSSNLKNIIEQFCKDTVHVIAEVNGQIIKSPKWSEQTILPGDRVELINFVGGG